MIKRLRVKFVCINMTLIMIMLLALLVLLYTSTATNLESSSIAVLEAAAGPQKLPGRPGDGMMQPVFKLEERPDGSVMVIGGSFFDLSDQKLVSDIYLKAQAQGESVGVLEEYSLRFCREEGKFGSSYAFMDISAEQQTLKDLLSTCVLLALGGFAGFLAVSILLARWAIRPVEQAWQQQRQFVADASHELKTPLTVILTNAEMLRAPEYSPEEKSRCADSILEVSHQMKDLVESLLQLARADRGDRKTEKALLDLSNLTEQAILPFEPLYFERGLELESAIEPQIQVLGDSAALRQTVNILLDNGQKYAVPGKPAKMTLTRQGKKALLQFFTPGAPLTARQCEDVFKRFYRVEESRTTSGSYGLGLSIARNIVESHGGRIWATAAEDGNVFCVTLPEA